jgi:hypothetical protein
VIAASWLVTDTSGGSFCLTETVGSGVLEVRDCSGASWPVDVTCYRPVGDPPPTPEHGFLWVMSASATDAGDNWRPWLEFPLWNLYLWMMASDEVNGLSAAEFALEVPPGVLNLAFVPQSGFLNAGDATHLLLAVGGCPRGPVVAGYWNLFTSSWGDEVGSYTLGAPGTLDPRTLDCTNPAPLIYPLQVVPFVVGTVAIEPVSWGHLKALYR